MSYQHLIIERHGPVGWLINNRPDVRNAMNNAMRDEFAEAWTELNEDPSVRVIVHTGEGLAQESRKYSNEEPHGGADERNEHHVSHLRRRTGQICL